MLARKALLWTLGLLTAVVVAGVVWAHYYEQRVNWLADTVEGRYWAVVEHHTPILKSGKLPLLTQQILGLDSDDLPDRIRFVLLCQRANAYSRLLKWDSAQVDFLAALSLDPKRAIRDRLLHEMLLLCWYKGQRERALAMYDQLFAAAPREADLHVRIAEFLATQEGIEHEPALALTHARKACELENSRRCLDVLAKAYALAEQYDDAVLAQEKALLVRCDGPQFTNMGQPTHLSDVLAKKRLMMYKQKQRVRKNIFLYYDEP